MSVTEKSINELRKTLSCIQVDKAFPTLINQ